MYVSKVLISMKDASIYMRMSTDMIIPNSSKAKATLGVTAYAIHPPSLSSGQATLLDLYNIYYINQPYKVLVFLI